MSIQVYINGQFVPREEAKVSVFDHGYLYGDGVFEGIRAYNGRVFKLTEHLDRLYESARSILLTIPLSWKELEEAVLESCRRNNIWDGYIRLVVSRGEGDLGLDPRKCPHPNVVIIADKIKLYPEELYQQGLKVITVPTRRNHTEALNARIKSLNYLNSILAKIEGNLHGYEEVILLNSEGYVTECSADNIFIVRRGVLVTPPNYLGILEGITRNTVMELAGEMGIRAEERVFGRHDIYVAEECFLTGTGAELVPVVEVDGRTIGTGKPGETYRKILGAFRELTQLEGTPIYGS